jgi:hypothetical protein
MTEDLPGVRAEVKFDRVPLWQSLTGRMPFSVRHAERGHVWLVTQLAEAWQHPRPRAARGQPVLAERYVVHVDGPLPGKPGQGGRFMMELCAYGHLEGWWIIPLT